MKFSLEKLKKRRGKEKVLDFDNMLLPACIRCTKRHRGDCKQTEKTDKKNQTR